MFSNTHREKWKNTLCYTWFNPFEKSSFIPSSCSLTLDCTTFQSVHSLHSIDALKNTWRFSHTNRLTLLVIYVFYHFTCTFYAWNVKKIIFSILKHLVILYLHSCLLWPVQQGINPYYCYYYIFISHWVIS